MLPSLLENNGDKKGLPFNSSCPLFFVQTLQKRYFFSKNVTEEKINRGKKTVENEEGKISTALHKKKFLKLNRLSVYGKNSSHKSFILSCLRRMAFMSCFLSGFQLAF